MSTESVPVGAAVVAGNVRPEEKAGRPALPSPAPHVLLQPHYGATWGWTGATLWPGRHQGGTWLAGRLPAQADALTGCQDKTWPWSWEPWGPGVPRACVLLLPPPTCTHPAPTAGCWVSIPPFTHPQQEPFPKPLHSSQPPASRHSPRPSFTPLWALSLPPLPGTNGKLFLLQRKGGWETKLCPFRGHHLSLALQLWSCFHCDRA